MQTTSRRSGEWDIKLKTMRSDNPYSKLNRRLFLKGLYAAIFSIALVFFARSVTQGRIANHIVQFILWFTPMSSGEATQLYWSIIGRNLDYILCAVMIFCMFLLFGVFLRAYRNYFEEVIHGIEQLGENKSRPIVLSSELKAVENKLNSVCGELAAREREARMAEQQKNELVVYLAHDIKTPLTSVIGYLNLLNDKQNLSDTQKAAFLRIALEKANRLELLVDEFFEITRYSLESEPPDRSAVNLCCLFVQLIDELYPMSRANGKIVINEIDENTVVWGDAEKLARAFNNILKNAITYSTEKSTIRIRSDFREDTPTIHICSKGVIPPEQLSHVFEKSFRADTARRTDTGGAGLGLAISKSIIELHGGSIGAQCNDTHTIFSVRLPAFRNN